jgi:hypothetical protein
MALSGRSNGGLLVGATMTMRPDLAKVAFPGVAVLEANGIDSKVYTGYAFGMGVERIANLKYKVKDLRMFSENDTRFLEEFEAAN